MSDEGTNGDSLHCHVRHFCRLCGATLQPRRTKSGKKLGSIYYTKLCDECLPLHRAEHAKRNANYDKFRKHWTRKCKVCGTVFDVKGKTNSGTLKTCSTECESELHRLNAIRRNYAEATLGPNREKGWVKTFEAAQTKDAVRLGPSHWNSAQVFLKSPDGDVYDVCNVVHFVRTNEHLFDEDDVAWVAAKKRSRVKAVGRRPSHAVGCLKCHASSGLHSVASGRRRTWKGWMMANAGVSIPGGEPGYDPRECSVCSWQEDTDGNWLTSCGTLHMFLAGNVKENRHVYCPYCGKIISEQNAGDQVSSEAR